MPEDFAARFAALKLVLDDGDAQFATTQMLKDLRVLLPLAPDPQSKVRLNRELAVLLAKSDDNACLDVGATTVKGQEATPVLTDREMYWMHLGCADTGMLTEISARTLLHLEEAARLHAVLDMPEGQLFAIRMHRAVFAKVKKTHRHGLDLMEPLLRDAEVFYGANDPDLEHLLSQIAHASDMEGDVAAAAAYRLRRIALLARSQPGD